MSKKILIIGAMSVVSFLFLLYINKDSTVEIYDNNIIQDIYNIAWSDTNNNDINTPTEETYIDQWLSIKYPSDRKIRTDDSKYLVTFLAPWYYLEDNNRPFISISKTEVPTFMSNIWIDEWYNLAKEKIQKKLPSRTEYTNINITINWLVTKQIVFKYTEDWVEFKWQQNIFFKGRYLYVITYDSIIDTFNKFINPANTIMQSISIKD